MGGRVREVSLDRINRSKIGVRAEENKYLLGLGQMGNVICSKISHSGMGIVDRDVRVNRIYSNFTLLHYQ